MNNTNFLDLLTFSNLLEYNKFIQDLSRKDGLVFKKNNLKVIYYLDKRVSLYINDNYIINCKLEYILSIINNVPELSTFKLKDFTHYNI